MIRKYLPFLDSFLELSYYERLKFMFLGAMSFCLIASYILVYPTEKLIFLNIVSKSYQYYANQLTAAICFPTIYFYTLLIDRVKRETLVHIVFITYALICFIFAYLFLNPTNQTNIHHFFRCFFYIIMNICSLVIMPTIWSYTNAINTPTSASHGYALKSILTRIAGFIAFETIDKKFYTSLNALSLIPFILMIIGILLFLISLFTLCITLFIPQNYLEGYQPEALAQAQEEKKLITNQNSVSFFEKTIAPLKGLWLLISNPYVFGIFGMVYCSHIILEILFYQKKFLTTINSNNSFPSSGIFFLSYGALFHLVGLFLAIFALTSLLKKYGLTLCLMITPTITMILIGVLFSFPSLLVNTIISILFTGINFGFNYPIREMLFIPTSHDIKYKANVWIEFASRSFARASGIMDTSFSPQGASFALIFTNIFLLLVAVVWLILAYLVGRKYELAVKYSQVIGRNT